MKSNEICTIGFIARHYAQSAPKQNRLRPQNRRSGRKPASKFEVANFRVPSGTSFDSLGCKPQESGQQQICAAKRRHSSERPDFYVAASRLSFFGGTVSWDSRPRLLNVVPAGTKKAAHILSPTGTPESYTCIEYALRYKTDAKCRCPLSVRPYCGAAPKRWPRAGPRSV